MSYILENISQRLIHKAVFKWFSSELASMKKTIKFTVANGAEGS